ncbi:MAG TPA: HEAT repeat domain-containing protein, partial [Bryobacteraceae bacterium]|nr:HEAT repeat domain-containing protein [Bryobacteraceae bacterium]
MNRTTTNFGIRWALGLLLAGGGLYGNLTAPASILQLEQAADLIVNGTVSGAAQNGATFSFSVQVGRVIKGDPSLAGTSVPAFWESGGQPPAGSGASIRGSGIWFLQRMVSAWRVIPVTQETMDFGRTYFPASSGTILSAYAYTQGASVEDKLASEISSAIESGSAFVPQFDSAMAGGLLDELKSPVLAVLYRRLANSASTDQRLLGLSGLIRAQDASALADAARLAATVRNDPAEGVLLLSVQIYFRATDPSAVSALGSAATGILTSNTDFREAAAHALASIHTNAALPFLATLLDDPDLNLRVEGVGGIGAFANGLPVQTKAGVPGL